MFWRACRVSRRWWRWFFGCSAVVSTVREAVESRWGCRLRRRCCAANPPLGPSCVLRAVREAVPVLGQLPRVTPASWLKAPKRRRRGRRTSLSLAFREGRRGRRRRDHWLGRVPVLSPLLLATVAGTQETSGPSPSTENLGKEEWRGSLVLTPRLLRSFPAASDRLLPPPYLAECFLAGVDKKDTFAGVILEKILVSRTLGRHLTT